MDLEIDLQRAAMLAMQRACNFGVFRGCCVAARGGVGAKGEGMYTRATPGEMYTRSPQADGRSGAAATEPLLGAGEVYTKAAVWQQQALASALTPSASLLSTAGRAELKLCVWMALAYFFMFTAYLSSQTLASTLPIPPPASGDTAMFIVYITFTFSSFWSPIFVHHVGAKPCIQIGFLMYGTYIAANLYPRTWTLYPGAAMVGLAASPLWVSQGILITHFALMFAEKRGEKDGTAHVGFFNGIFSSFMVMTGVVGNLVSSFVFNGYNGACSGTGSGSRETEVVVPQSAVNWLFSVYLCFTALAVATATCTLPSMDIVEREREKYYELQFAT